MKPSDVDLPPIYLVWWLDAKIDQQSAMTLGHKDQADKFGGLCLCADVGFIARENDKEIVLAVAATFDDEGTDLRHANTIPKSLIIGKPRRLK